MPNAATKSRICSGGNWLTFNFAVKDVEKTVSSTPMELSTSLIPTGPEQPHEKGGNAPSHYSRKLKVRGQSSGPSLRCAIYAATSMNSIWFSTHPGLVFCPPGERREMIFGLVISFSMWQCAGHGDAAGPGFVH